MNSSMSPTADDRLIRVPLECVLPHPLNANVMSEEMLTAVVANIARSGRYPPLIVRPHPTEPDCVEILDGAQRKRALERLGHTQALCFVWPCSDEEALVLLATLNRLEGADDPGLRAELLRELGELLGDELPTLVPEDARAVEDALAMLDLGDFEDAFDVPEPAAAETTVLSFAVPSEHADALLSAVEARAGALSGRHRRGRALVALCLGEPAP